MNISAWLSTGAAKPEPQRPAKRLKVAQGNAGADDASETSGLSSLPAQAGNPQLRPETSAPEGDDDDDDADGGAIAPHTTHDLAFESSLPPVRTDEAAVEEYEVMRASQASEPDETTASRLDSRKWVRGKSSIYVDAFNLALDTVLEDEAHLFDQREGAVFREWRGLDYEAQYLYVRLFLRKTSAWHRSSRLGYHGDLSDPDAAIRALQKPRDLASLPPASACDGDHFAQEWSLGETFTFADTSDECISTVEEAVSLLGLDELKALAKDAKVQGRNKADLQKALARRAAQQSNLTALGLGRPSAEGPVLQRSPGTAIKADTAPRDAAAQGANNQNSYFLHKIMATAGPCVRLSNAVFRLFERVHLLFYRSTEWTEKSLKTIVLSKISRRNFPEYIVCRSSHIFASREALLEFEHALRMEYEVDQVLEASGSPGEAGFRRVLAVFDGVSARWRHLLREEQRREDCEYKFNEGGYLRRLNAAHAYTRIAHKAAYVHGRLHDYRSEHGLLCELLGQQLFQVARRGAWYQRKALLEEHYMAAAAPDPDAGCADDGEQQKKHWRRAAAATCEAALQDRDCHLIYHYDLQKRLVKLERRLKIPRRLQHDFGHVRLHAPEEHTVGGVQLRREAAAAGAAGATSTKTVWVDEAEAGGECSVEAMCLSHYRAQGWKGYHAEGGIVRTLFAYLFYDVLFAYVPNVFQTAYQTCPLDLHTDAFFPARASAIHRRLADICNGAAERIVRRVHAAHADRRTCVVGLNWDFGLDDVAELAACFRGDALAAICKVMAQEYRQRGGGIPDLLLWRSDPQPDVLFAEVKSANDRLSDTQRLWIHVLTGAGVRVALCSAVATEVRAA